MNILDELKWRGILKQISNEEKFKKLIPGETGIYCGFDPTALSLHLGNYILISVLKRFKKAGFNVYAIVGGATGMIGDPSFKDKERVLLDNQAVVTNKNAIKNQLRKQGLKVIDNYSFYRNINILEFLRDAGKLINVASILSRDSIVNCLERGLSFTEFSYTLLQGYDFLTLYKQKNVCIQLGGSDQWGNIVTGLDMINRVYGDNHQAVGITMDLLTDENGNKIGKSTGGGALWLDPKMCSPYRFYQYLFNQSDATSEKLIKWLTFLPKEKIEQVISKHYQNPKLHLLQKTLAQQVTKDIFGAQGVKFAQKITSLIYKQNISDLNLSLDEFEELKNYLPVVEIEVGANTVDTLIAAKHIQSKREAREFIQTKSLKINGMPFDETSLYETKLGEGKFAIIKKGKKTTILAVSK
ncbi:tyrosine--tRNA ligase [Mycoplasmopsis columbinasalis]|uniref:Tyrosine--tRNA ligase n=1 Tax=Mycoplasmopsis columbinasalis TaxID=114880 RepID=A0A449BAQ9_9BACT|nr:tyrosine--tRNA ligase [Mycoplasmopsis columbinasalis]VEU78117.1 tyrosyl tRNA synthetase [Mycoplasmopsis columbinasalis]